MIQFNEIMQRIEEVIAAGNDNRRIYNKEIAQALNLTPEYFAVIKKRGKIPYEAIATFCRNRKISINWVLFEQKPQKL
ncbi:MAG TPA: hypothetical protein ENK72_01270 [Epsilonproteobacteria bacterium]|nr:hypothetical protein [Campylobacterota bacterium]HHD72573.1 hypothetical protein [Campylobacterota bacterium]